MVKNYILVTSRSLAKHRFFTIINVVGLAVGMSIGLLLIAVLSFLWTYDTFHEKKENIYRVISHVDDKASNRDYALAPLPLADRIKQEYPGVKEVVRISASLNTDAVYETKEFPVRGYFVEPNFFDVFTFPWIRGSAQTLNKPNTIAITQKLAAKIFGDTDPLGKVMTMGEFGDFEITGLLKDHPKNSHMHFEALASYTTLEKSALAVTTQSWTAFPRSYVYLLLPAEKNTESLERYLDTTAKQVYKNEKDFSASFELQSLMSIAPGRILSNQIGPDWEYASLSMFIILTLLILLPACFNYATISISRALKRMKEIGLRKALGAQQQQIFFQFIAETVCITLLALGLAYYIFVSVRQEFLSMLVGGNELLNLDMNWTTFSYFVVFALFVGIAAGVIPALYFSKLNPIQALKSKPTGRGTSRLGLRKVLMVTQFALSLGFITGVVIILSQYRQALNYDFGFQQENIVDVPLQGVDPGVFRNEFAKLSAVQEMSMSSNVIGASASESVYVKNEHQDSVEVFQMYVDEHYLGNLKLTLLSGDNFEPDRQRESQIIVNEAFLREFKITDPRSAIGQVVQLPDQRDATVVGVVKDFHYAELSEPIKSFCFRYGSNYQFANLKVSSTDIVDTFAQFEAAWKALGAEPKFTAKFFDDEIEETYSFHLTMVKICGFLGFLAITISCLGLLGMVVFTVENRTKEVGIRKVMGASTQSMIIMLSRDFAKLMVIATMIAMPLAYLFFDKVYLRTQAYKFPIGVTEMVLSVLIMMALGLVTILSQTAKAARINPVDTLRYE